VSTADFLLEWLTGRKQRGKSSVFRWSHLR